MLRGNDEGWGSTLIVTLLSCSVLLMVAFVLAELRHPRPMFDLSLLRQPAFVGVSVATFALGSGMFAIYPYLTLYLQDDLGYSALKGGLCLLPSTVPTFFVPLATRSLAERMPPRVVLSAGLAITAAGILLMHGLTVASTWTALVPGLLLTGIGIGIANPAIARTGLGVVPPERTGMASGISNTFRIGGFATGVAALGAIFQHHVSSSLETQLGRHAEDVAKALVSGGTRAAQRAAPADRGVLAASHHAFVSGMNEIFGIGAVVVILGSIAGFTLVRARDFDRPPTVAASGQQAVVQASAS